MSKRFLLLIVLASLLLASMLAGCGGAKATPTLAPTTASTQAPTKAPTMAPTVAPTPTSQSESGEAAAGDPAKGEELFKSQTLADNPGCITCHSLEPGKTLVGPSMAGIATDAAGDAAEAGISTEEMLKTMIVDPNDEIAEGFPKDVMPQDWGKKLTPEQLNDVIAFLMTLKQ